MWFARYCKAHFLDNFSTKKKKRCNQCLTLLNQFLIEKTWLHGKTEWGGPSLLQGVLPARLPATWAAGRVPSERLAGAEDAVGGGCAERLLIEVYSVLSQQLGVPPAKWRAKEVSIALAFRRTVCTQFHQDWQFRPNVPTKSSIYTYIWKQKSMTLTRALWEGETVNGNARSH